MEILSIRSFQVHGHDYHLYAYEPIENLPAGVVVQDANEILPRSSIFQYTGYATYAGFANFFRYKLLLERGGWWADTDVVCLRPFEFAFPYVFGSETCSRGIVPASAVIRCPPVKQWHTRGTCVRRKSPSC
jgi:Glycosyltransferase sugar-binding region containing DXD motif